MTVIEPAPPAVWEPIGNPLARALAAVQAELPVVPKTKTAFVKTKEGSYTYNYADLADVSNAILPLLGRHGLSWSVMPGHEFREGRWQYGLHYFLTHESGEAREGWWEIETTGGMQMTGGRISYARRYALCAVTGVAAEDDLDGAQAQLPQGGTRQRAAVKGDGSAPPPGEPRRTAQRRTSTPAAREGQPSASPADSQPAPAPPVTTRPPLPGEEMVTQAQPGDEPNDGPIRRHLPGTITEDQRKAIMALFGELGFTRDQRAERLSLATKIVGRELTSANDLSKSEAGNLIDFIVSHETDYAAIEQALLDDERPAGWAEEHERARDG